MDTISHEYEQGTDYIDALLDIFEAYHRDVTPSLKEVLLYRNRSPEHTVRYIKEKLPEFSDIQAALTTLFSQTEDPRRNQHFAKRFFSRYGRSRGALDFIVPAIFPWVQSRKTSAIAFTEIIEGIDFGE